jgi:hypothetical protein
MTKDADETVFGERAGGPTVGLDRSEPFAGGVVKLVGGVAQRDKYAEIEQVHGLEGKFVPHPIDERAGDGFPRLRGPFEHREAMRTNGRDGGLLFREVRSGAGGGGTGRGDMLQALDDELAQRGAAPRGQYLGLTEQGIGQLDGRFHMAVDMGLRLKVNEAGVFFETKPGFLAKGAKEAKDKPTRSGV